jgi:hypothetical protein
LKLISFTLAMSLSLLFCTNAFAAYARCRWSVEGSGVDPMFKDDPLYKPGPKMIGVSACASGHTTVGKDGPKPLCFGYLYCESEQKSTPPKIETVSCFAEQANGKWRCPSGMKCASDEKVALDTNPHTPSRPKTGAVPAAASTSGALK